MQIAGGDMNDLRKAYRTAAFIGLAMIASVLIYAIIVELVRKGTIPLTGVPEMSADRLNSLKYVLFGVSAVLFFLIRIINGKILSKGAPAGPVRAAAPPEIQRLVTAAVASYALSEAPAIFGLIVFFLGRVVEDFYVFMLISLFFFSYYFPKYSQWEEWARRKGSL
jgi:F0F1-type ATP synthase membrane subunit c/vacuolar-type H+-ATPase subunit K